MQVATLFRESATLLGAANMIESPSSNSNSLSSISTSSHSNSSSSTHQLSNNSTLSILSSPPPPPPSSSSSSSVLGGENENSINSDFNINCNDRQQQQQHNHPNHHLYNNILHQHSLTCIDDLMIDDNRGYKLLSSSVKPEIQDDGYETSGGDVLTPNSHSNSTLTPNQLNPNQHQNSVIMPRHEILPPSDDPYNFVDENDSMSRLQHQPERINHNNHPINMQIHHSNLQHHQQQHSNNHHQFIHHQHQQQPEQHQQHHHPQHQPPPHQQHLHHPSPEELNQIHHHQHQQHFQQQQHQHQQEHLQHQQQHQQQQQEHQQQQQHQQQTQQEHQQVPQQNSNIKKRGRKKKNGQYDDDQMFDSSTNQPEIGIIKSIVVKERKKHDRFNGMSEEEVSRKTLPDHLANNLDIIIIGINPGLFAAYKGHHYAGPGNHFWKCLYLSGLTREQMQAEEDYKLLDFGIGFTNMVQRATKGSADLTRKEIKEGSKILMDKLKQYRPKVAVFNGKLIFEVFSGKKDFNFGRQPDLVEGTNTYMWVMPSSSARCAQLPRAADKVPFYTGLKKFRDYLNGIITELDDSDISFHNQNITNTGTNNKTLNSISSNEDSILTDIETKIITNCDLDNSTALPSFNSIDNDSVDKTIQSFTNNSEVTELNNSNPNNNSNNSLQQNLLNLNQTSNSILCNKKKRGRPKKDKAGAVIQNDDGLQQMKLNSSNCEYDYNNIYNNDMTKKKRGRPKKVKGLNDSNGNIGNNCKTELPYPNFYNNSNISNTLLITDTTPSSNNSNSSTSCNSINQSKVDGMLNNTTLSSMSLPPLSSMISPSPGLQNNHNLNESNHIGFSIANHLNHSTTNNNNGSNSNREETLNQNTNNVGGNNDVSTKSLSGLESLVDQIPSSEESGLSITNNRIAEANELLYNTPTSCIYTNNYNPSTYFTMTSNQPLSSSSTGISTPTPPVSSYQNYPTFIETPVPLNPLYHHHHLPLTTYNQNYTNYHTAVPTIQTLSTLHMPSPNYPYGYGSSTPNYGQNVVVPHSTHSTYLTNHPHLHHPNTVFDRLKPDIGGGFGSF